MGLGQFAGLRGNLMKKRGLFFRGVDTPMHTKGACPGNSLGTRGLGKYFQNWYAKIISPKETNYTKYLFIAP